jgi:hypothetical protein
MSIKGRLMTMGFLAISAFGTTMFMASSANAIVVATPLQALTPLTISASVARLVPLRHHTRQDLLKLLSPTHFLTEAIHQFPLRQMR